MFDATEFFEISNTFMSTPERLSANCPESGCLLLLEDKLEVPVMISAPHAIAHIREGKKKYAEPDTAALAISLVPELKCAGLINIDGNRDPNFDKDKPFCDVMEEVIKKHDLRAVLDLHESDPNRSYSFAVGTGFGANINDDPEIAPALLAICEKHGVQNAVADLPPYAAIGEDRIATTMNRRCGVPAVQLEINCGYLTEDDPKYAPEKVYNVVRDMVVYLGRM